MRARTLLGVATLLLVALSACSNAASSASVDEELSADLLPQFAACLDLPPSAVEFEVDEEARVVSVKWVDNEGVSDRDLGETSSEDCLEELGLEMYTGE